MNGIELRLLALLQMAESPLYSAYRWLGDRVGRELSMREFLLLVDRLLASDILRLWSSDSASQDRSRLDAVPDGLEQRYGQLEDLDGTFDPFALSLTVGPSADLQMEPEWEVDFAFEHKTFELNALRHAEARAIATLGQLLNVELVEEERVPRSNARVELSGLIREVNPADAAE